MTITSRTAKNQKVYWGIYNIYTKKWVGLIADEIFRKIANKYIFQNFDYDDKFEFFNMRIDDIPISMQINIPKNFMRILKKY